MKVYVQLLLLIVLVFVGFGSRETNADEYYSFGSYRLVRSHYDSGFVNGVDTPAIVKTLYPSGYDVIKRSHYYDYAMDYSIGKNGGNSGALLRVGIFPTVQEAEETTLRYLCSNSGPYKEGSSLGLNIGDNCWYREEITGGSGTAILSKILFLRKNAFFQLGIGADKIDIIPIAEAIDSMLIHGSLYIELSNTLDPPVITDIQLSKKEIETDDVSFMKVIAYDPKGKKLEYERTPGIVKSADDPDNMFRIYASRDNWSEPFYGSHIIEAWVINEDGFVSRKYSTQITFSPPPR